MRRETIYIIILRNTYYGYYYYDEFRKVIKNSYTYVVGLRDITEQNGCKMTNAYDMGYIIIIKYKYCDGRG